MSAASGSLKVWLLALLCAALGYGLYDQSARQSLKMPEPVNVPEKPNDTRVSELSPGLTPLTDIADLNQMIDRPLFSQSRRPASPVTGQDGVQPVPDMSPFEFKLSGVMIVNNRRIALLNQTKGRKVWQGVVGQTIEGWEIQLIEPNYVVLERSGKTLTLKLQDRQQIAPRQPAAIRKLKNQATSPSVQPRRPAINRRLAPPQKEPENGMPPDSSPSRGNPSEG